MQYTTSQLIGFVTLLCVALVAVPMFLHSADRYVTNGDVFLLLILLEIGKPALLAVFRSNLKG